eukprot:722098-Amphidinium_carterae.1
MVQGQRSHPRDGKVFSKTKSPRNPLVVEDGDPVTADSDEPALSRRQKSKRRAEQKARRKHDLAT